VNWPRSKTDLACLPHLLLTVLAVRLASLGLTPLADTTEARYGEIARLMATTGDWITPQVALGVPFWAKPPLSTWLSAASLSAFGINAFAARLPSLILGIAVLWLLHRLARTRYSQRGAWTSMVVLGTMPLFFVSIGAVMTDPALLLGTTLSMVAFWIAIAEDNPSPIWGYLFFVGLAIGMLAKGPIGVVMTGVPVGLWVLLSGRWARTWQRLPWMSGTVLAAVLTVPWYVAAEIKTPGFLEYFLVGEHWKRFVVPDWQGDRYGSAHARPWGTIWIYWLLATAPWSIAAFARLRTSVMRQEVGARLREHRDWYGYLVVWLLTPMLFFTVAGNILWTYVLTGLPAVALLVAGILSRADADPAAASGNDKAAPLDRTVSRLALGMTGLMLTALVLVIAGLVPDEISQKAMISEYRHQRDSPSDRLVYVDGRPDSAAFYSGGKALEISSAEALAFLSDETRRDCFVIHNLDALPPGFLDRVEEIVVFGRYHLLMEK